MAILHGDFSLVQLLNSGYSLNRISTRFQSITINNAIPPAVSNSDTIGGFIGALKNVAANWTEGEAQQPLPASTNVRGGGQSFTIEYRPTIYINGDKPGDLEERLKENNETLLLMFKDFLRKQRDDEGRMAYA